MLNHFPSGHFQEPHPWFHKSGDLDSTTFESIKEAMFEKPLTPSDVGKLNRLVIPKQHAERYFPLSAGDAAGTLLGFEDESGKSWRFRYSYWNSSQSYVLTKGWSRYVKDKRLDAGDVVFFERHRDDRHKLFIGWRRRGSAAPSSPVCYNAQAYQTHNYQPDVLPRHPRGGPVVEEEELTRVQSGSNNIMNEDNYNNNPRRLVRLFGVNFECEEEESSVGRTTSSQGSTSSNSNSIIHNNQAYRDYFNYMGLGAYPAAAAPSTFQMDMEFGERQMGNRMG